MGTVVTKGTVAGGKSAQSHLPIMQVGLQPLTPWNMLEGKWMGSH